MKRRGFPSRLVQSDNFTLIPASQLPFRQHWEAIAANLPAGEALLVYPDQETPLLGVMRAVVPQLRSRGRHVTAVVAQPVN